METMEKLDKQTFNEISKKEKTIEDGLDNLSDNIKKMSIEDSQVFARAYPPNPNIDTCKKKN